MEMNMPALFSRYRPEIDSLMKKIVCRRESQLYDMIRYHLGWIDENGAPFTGDSGKALRPGLCLLACEAVCGDHAKALPAAVAIELVHNYSLIHDDIQDSDAERRHRPTVWKIWGVPQAINAGTAAKVIASMALGEYRELGFTAEKTVEIVMIIEEATLHIIEGQHLDIGFENMNDISVHQYLEMIRNKTGALISAALRAGATAGCGERRTAEKFGELGMMLGIAFQARDDILGIWGSAEATGKPEASDIRRKKKSLPVVHMLSSASKSERASLDRIYAMEQIDDCAVRTVMTLLESTGARESAEALVDSSSARCFEIIDSLPIDYSYRTELKTITESLSGRDR